MNKIFEIWSMEYLMFIIIAVIICVSVIYLIVLLPMKKFDNAISELKELNNLKTIFENNEKEFHKGNKTYPKVNIFSDVCVCRPILFSHICLIAWGIVDFFDSCVGTVCAALLTPVFIVGYIHCYHRVKKYNEDLEKRIIIKGIVSDEVIYRPAGFRDPSKIIVKYTYVDPQGKEHSSLQRIYKFSTLVKRWKRIYYKGAEVSILLNINNYRDSYLPMSETYSKIYKLFYGVQIEYDTF